MGTRVPLILGFWLGFWLLTAAEPASARAPVVVELFTAQGCAACVKAGDLTADLAARPHVLVLTFDVDYWDYLGWQDTFAKSEFTARQRAYLKPLGVHDAYTPEIVVGGRQEAPAVDPQGGDRLIQAALHASQDPPQVVASKTRVSVGSGRAPKGGGEIWLVRYDPKAQSVTVKNGETRGSTIVEHNVVRELIRLGAWRGKPRIYRLPAPADDNLTSVVIVQGARGGPIITARTL